MSICSFHDSLNGQNYRAGSIHLQIVLTVPKRVRFFPKDRRTLSAVIRIFMRALESEIRKACPKAPPVAPARLPDQPDMFFDEPPPDEVYTTRYLPQWAKTGMKTPTLGKGLQDHRNPQLLVCGQQENLLTHSVDVTAQLHGGR